MSFRVLLIAEDFRLDRYLLEPVLERLLQAAGRPRSKIVVCMDPLVAGVRQALDWPTIESILDVYPMVDCFVLVVDRDGHEGRRQRLDELEARARDFLGPDRHFVAENAWQEVEVWALAGMRDLPSDWSWQDIRQEPDAKKRYFVPYASGRGLDARGSESRRVLGREAAQSYPRIRKLCPEDVGNLETRLRS